MTCQQGQIATVGIQNMLSFAGLRQLTFSAVFPSVGLVAGSCKIQQLVCKISGSNVHSATNLDDCRKHKILPRAQKGLFIIVQKSTVSSSVFTGVVIGVKKMYQSDSVTWLTE